MSLSLAATMILVEELRHRGEDFCLVTVIRTANATSAKAGAKAVVTRRDAARFHRRRLRAGCGDQDGAGRDAGRSAPPDPGTAKGRRR